jgi:hypothetical protein
MENSNTRLLRQLPPVLPSKRPSSLDTLAQLGTEQKNPVNSNDFEIALSAVTDEKNQSVLVKRARAKFISSSIALRLVDVDSPLRKGYWNSYYCCSTLVKTGDKVTGKYCKNRWCLVCNRIRTARLIHSYKPILETWPEKHFLTLTIPNVSAIALPIAVESMHSVLKQIIHKFKVRTQRGGNLRLRGLRKFECTYNPDRNDYHPHFHLICETLAVAQAIQTEWLVRFPSASILGQDIRPASGRDCIELFKYFTKLITKNKRTNQTNPVNPLTIDTIFQSIIGIRIFQNFGFKLSKAAEEEEILETLEIATAVEEMVFTWYQLFHDWISPDGICLSGYSATDNMVDFVNTISGGKNENEPAHYS